MDTSPDAPGAGVEPIVHRDYDGGAHRAAARRHGARPGRHAALAAKAGHDIVTSSGDTLLGADDKAGVAEIMAAVAHLAAHPELPRPTLRVGFTPDEEIGEGATLFDVERFGAVCAYTLDGSELGELQDETFTAAEVDADDPRRRRPPRLRQGQARQRRPARRRGSLAALPPDRLTPETHRRAARASSTVYEIDGDAGSARRSRAIVRDFDDDLLDAARRAAAAHRRGGRRRRAAGAARGRGHAAVPEHAPLPRARSREVVDGGRARRSAPRASSRARTPIRGGTDGSRAQRDGPADAEPLHGRPRVPLACASGRRCRTWPRPRRRSCGWREVWTRATTCATAGD